MYESWSGSKVFDTLIYLVILKEFFEKINFLNMSTDDKIIKNYPACKELTC